MAKLGAEPFFFAGGEEGVLLIHGYTGAPGEMRLLGEFLHRKGYTVLGVLLPGHCTTPKNLSKYTFDDWYALGVLLPGHCTTPKNLSKYTFDDWYAEVKRGYARLKARCSRVYVAGLSMGGLLTLRAAAELEPDKAVVMAAPIYVHDRRQFLLPWLHFLIRYVKKQQRVFDGVPEEYCVQCEAMPTKPLISMFKFVKECKRGYLKNITVPCLIMQSKIEHTVRRQSAQFIYDNIASKQKELVWFEHCGHILTLDKERGAVFNKILAFLQE